MKKYNKLSEVRLNQIRPSGWILDFLKKQGEGIPGNLHKIGYPYDKACWQYRTLAGGGYEQWWPYEQTAYWIDSVVRTAALTDDEKLLSVVMEQVEASFADDGDPFIGPLDLKPHNGRNRWPHTVYFRALYALWSNTGDEKYLKKMAEHYKSDTYDYAFNRDIVNIEIMLKLYEYYEDEFFLKKAKESYKAFNEKYDIACADEMMSDKIATAHGVSFNEDGKLPAILYSYTGDEYLLESAVNGYKKNDVYHMLPDGIHSCSEGTCGNETFRTHESCDISDHTWSLGYLLEATGNGEYADKIEWAIFNALPGAVGPYFKTIQYLSCVNQVIATKNSTHIEQWKNTPRMAYQPHHYPECCVANIGRAMPNYAARMYHTTKTGVAVSLYGDSVFTGDYITITQTGGYPFGDSVDLKIKLTDASKNELKLRIPAWSKHTVITINGERASALTTNGYASVKIADGDNVKITFTKAFLSHNSADGGVYYTYGPHLLSLRIKEKIEIDETEPRQTKDFPALCITPESDWAYAVTGWEKAELCEGTVTQSPYWDGIPFSFRLKARKLNNWELVREKQEKNDLDNVQGEGVDNTQVNLGATVIDDDLLLTPYLPDASFIEKNLGEEEEITLIPYGCTNLRLTVFPKYKR